jgi:hypothetical protein
MTALDKYQRLEASGLWRENADAQRREVIVSIGDASLTICDMQDRPLTHWSIPAVERANPGKRPAIFHPDADPTETLEFAENEVEMIEAIETLRKALHYSNPRPGRLRAALVAVSFIALGTAISFWLPGALKSHATSVVQDINRTVIGQDVMSALESYTGPICSEDTADIALDAFSKRLGVRDIKVVRDGIRSTATLPGGVVLVSKKLLEDYEDPAVAAGFIAVEMVRNERRDPLGHLLEVAGVGASFRLLTTGQLSDANLQAFAEVLTTEDPFEISDEDAIAKFVEMGIRPSPYAYAVDFTGETTIGLVEADALIHTGDPVLNDQQWVGLQEICTN